MTGGDLVIMVSLFTAAVTGLGVFFGIPNWRLQRRAEKQSEEAERQAQLTKDLAAVLGGPHASEPRSPDNPAILDVLTDLRDALRDISELQTVVSIHISDGHGHPIPARLRR